MPAIKIQNFDGIYPRTSAYLLGENQAQIARNVKLISGELRAWRKPAPVNPQPTLVVDAIAIHRLEDPVTLDSVWLSWQSDVDAARSPIADETDGRLYFTGDGAPKKTTYALASAGAGPYPTSSLPLGVVAPTTAPTLGATGGSGGVQTRVYVYTYISTFGAVKEESAPSPPTSVDANAVDATVTVSGLGTASPTGYNITHKRIYRTIGGNTGIDYRLVAEIPITQASYNDVLNDVDVPGDPIISIDFAEPPTDLQGLQVVTGGFLVGFRGNEIWFSEPFFPHAWPAKYVLTTEFPIVGLGVVGNLVVACTIRFPELVYGQAPAFMTQEKVPLNEPCSSKRSISSDGQSVLYASPNGFVAIGAGVRQRFTDKLFRREEFERYIPASMYSLTYDGTYFSWFNSAQEGTGALLVNSTDRPALSVFQPYTTAAYVDTRTASLFYVDGPSGLLYEFDKQDLNQRRYIWRSKKFDLPFPSSLSAVQVYANYEYLREDFPTSEDIIELNQAILDSCPQLLVPVAGENTLVENTGLIENDEVDGAVDTYPVTGSTFPVAGSSLVEAAAAGSGVAAICSSLFGDINSYEINFFDFPNNGTALFPPSAAVDFRKVSVTVYGDGVEVATYDFTNERHKKLPAGRKYRTVEVEIRGNVPVYSITLATTAADLKDI